MIRKSADVSIVAPTYNNSCYISEFIESVNKSTVLPKELIIIDDGSTDSTYQVLEKFSSLHFLKILKFGVNKGLTTALNSGIELATGKFIMRADTDDIFEKSRIEKQVEFLEKNPEIDVVGCNVLYFNEKHENINQSNFPLTNKKITQTFKNGEHGIQHPTVCARAFIFKKYRYQPVFPAEDYEIFSRMVKDEIKFSNIPEVLYYKRVHLTNSIANFNFQVVNQTFNFRDKIFGTKTSDVKKRILYYHILHYFKYQISSNIFTKYVHLFLSACLKPEKLLNKIFTK